MEGDFDYRSQSLQIKKNTHEEGLEQLIHFDCAFES